MLRFDNYELKARIVPGFLLLVSPSVTVISLYRNAWPSISLPIFLTIFLIVSVPLSRYVRQHGKSIQAELWQDWGGSPLAVSLADNPYGISEHLIRRALIRLSKLYPGETPCGGSPSQYETVARMAAAYSTESGSPVVTAENIAYGFARNTFGVRRTGISVSAVCAVVLGSYLFCSVQPVIWLALTVVLIMLLWWLFGVTEEKVRTAGIQYAKAVIRWLGSEPIDNTS